MLKFEIIIEPKVELVFEKYPENVQPKLLALRKLIIDSAKEIENIQKLEETLKWGEPSYLTQQEVQYE